MGRKYGLAKYGRGTYDLGGGPILFTGDVVFAVNLSGKYNRWMPFSGEVFFEFDITGSFRYTVQFMGGIIVQVDLIGNMNYTTHMHGNLPVIVDLYSIKEYMGPYWGEVGDLPDPWAPIPGPPPEFWVPIEAAPSTEFWVPIVEPNPAFRQ